MQQFIRLAYGIFIATQLIACRTQPTTPPTQPIELTVSAASSLTEPFTQIGKQFEAINPGVRVVFNFAGSDKLAQQINEGAPVDIFASANKIQMANVIKGGRVISGTEQIFARNRLIVIYPKMNRAGIKTLSDLARPGLKIVLANPSVPIGSYSLHFLDKASLLPEYTSSYSPSVIANVVSYEENVRAVLGKVALDEADAGIVYTTDITKESAKNLETIEIPDSLNTIASYPVATIHDRPNVAVAQRFVAYLLSTEGQQILTQYGFIPNQEP
jgi:molybdate transport system substrate-binding protein